MTPRLESQLAALAAARIRLLPTPEIPTHLVLERRGFAALVARTGEGFGSAGSPGLLTEHGFAALVWRGERAVFVRKGSEEPATEEQVLELRRFAADLEAALAT